MSEIDPSVSIKYDCPNCGDEVSFEGYGWIIVSQAQAAVDDGGLCGSCLTKDEDEKDDDD